jgi:flagellar hook-length control protein FliK
MEQVAMNLMADLFSDKIASTGSTPGDPSNQLFRSLLEKSANSGKASSLNRGDRAAEETGTSTMESSLRRLGVPLGQLRLPKSAIPELTALLEGQGFNKEEIERLIASLSEKDGSIRIDRLFARLQKSEKSGKDNESFVIDAKDIPQIGEALAAMGLGAGKIKEIIESAFTRKGELSLEKLSGSLSAILPGVDSKSLLSSILERSQVQGSAKDLSKIAADPDVKKLVSDLAQAGQEGQKQIREEIGTLLREKGMQPQEIKSFLETLTASHARTISKNAGVDPEGARKAEADAKALMEKVVISSDRKPVTDETRERILQILQKEKVLGKEGLKKEWLQEEGISKTSGEQRAKSVTVDPMRVSEEKKTTLENGEAVGSRKPVQIDSKAGQTVEGMTGDLSAVRLQKSNSEAVAATSAREAVSLPDPLPKVIERMLWMIQGGEQKGRIHISPPELGRLDIDLVIKQGHLQAQLRAENPQVKELLDANLGQLKQQLADSGLVIDRFDVMIGLEQNPFSKEQTWTAGHQKGHSSRKEDEEESSSKTETGKPLTRRLSLSQIDMIV